MSHERYSGIGHCAVGYIQGDMPKAVKRKTAECFGQSSTNFNN